MNSWTNIPHVTNHDEADITELEEFRTSLTDIYTGEKKKITPLAFIVKALTSSLKKFPNFKESEKIYRTAKNVTIIDIHVFLSGGSFKKIAPSIADSIGAVAIITSVFATFVF